VSIIEFARGGTFPRFNATIAYAGNDTRSGYSNASYNGDAVINIANT